MQLDIELVRMAEGYLQTWKQVSFIKKREKLICSKKEGSFPGKMITQLDFSLQMESYA